jgi:zinc transport system permease protein
MLDDFIVRAALAGVGVAVAAAPLGCFVVWRRMAYFGDATAHSALFGVAMALALGISVAAGALAAALGMALAITVLSGRGWAVDTLLGVIAHAALAVGLLAASLTAGVRGDLSAYLFGDILAVSRADLGVIWAGALAVCALIGWRWSPLLTATIGPDLAAAGGIRPDREQLALTVALAITVAVALEVVGVLLIAAMLLIPPAAVRPFARSPEAMVWLAGLAGIAAALGGLWASFRWDTPTGPTIVAVAAALFVLSGLRGRRAG